MAVDPELSSRVTDITGAVPTEAAIIAGRAVQSGTIDLDSPAIAHAPVAIYAVDLAGRVRAWNDAAERLFGWTASEVIGELVPFVAPEGIDEALAGLVALMEGAEFTNIEFPVVRADGAERHCLGSSTMIRNATGEPELILAFALDITESSRATEQLKRTEYKWRTLLSNISDTVTIIGADGRVAETSGEFTDVLGYPSAIWVGADSLAFLHPDDQARAADTFAEIVAHPRVEFRDVFRTLHSDGHYELIEFTAVNMLDDPSVEGVVITTRNVTAVKQAESLLEDEAAVLELIARDAPLGETLPAIAKMVEYHSGGSAAIFLLSPDRHRLTIGAAGSLPRAVLDSIERRGLAMSPAGAAVERRASVIVPDFAADRGEIDAGRFDGLCEFGLRSGWSAPIIETRSGEVLGSITTFYDRPCTPEMHEQNVVAVASHLASIAIDRDHVQRELYHQARHHPLTNLPNRRSLVEFLESALQRCATLDTRLAVMFVDLDRFKMVNDSFGHAAGDTLLVRFGGRLQNLVRPGDFVSHFGADEFVVVLDDIADTEDVRFVANRLDLALSEPFSLEEGEIFLSASIGVAVSDGAVDASGLLQDADAAMYRAKELGRDRLEIFDQELRDRAKARLKVDHDLRVAIERSELVVHYQPKIDLSDGHIIGAEALLRWKHPEYGLLSPVHFINVAEDTGLITRIGRWVLEEAVHQASTFVDRTPGLGHFLVAVNLSARQLNAPDLAATVDRILRRYRWPAEQLSLELTESVLIDDAEATLLILQQLKELGVKLAIDDFGTGYSSLSYLHRFPVDIVKIDRSFVTPLRADGSGSAVATAVMHMAKALSLTTCAEGVEEPEHLDALRALGCDWAQGFLFSKAVPSEEFAALLTADPSW